MPRSWPSRSAARASRLLLARRLNRGYIQTLERSLLNRALELDFSDVEDLTTRTVMMRTIRSRTTGAASQKIGGQSSVRVAAVPSSVDPEIAEIMALRSRDRARVSAVLRHEEGMPATLVPHVIPLLAWDPVSEDAIYALRKVSEERIGELIDALIDPNQPFAVRRRLARVFSVCVSQRAADGLILGLDDQRFEVRFQCGRSLAAIVAKNPRIRIHDQAIYDVVLREVAVGQSGVGEPSPARRHGRPRTAVVRGPVHQGPHEPGAGPRLHAVVAGAAGRAAADCLSRAADRRREPPRDGARIPRRHAAAGDPGPVVAVPRGSPGTRTAPPARATKSFATCYALILQYN